MAYNPRIQLVPAPLWGMNLRTVMGGKVYWKRLRQALLARQGATCSTCGKVETSPQRVYAHEEWAYYEAVDPAVAFLWRVSLVCWHCHACEHPGVVNSLISQGTLTDRARLDTIAHFCRLNNATEDDWKAHAAEAQRDWMRRSKRRWTFDYGPFTDWMAARFTCEPFTGEPWNPDLAAKWNNREPLPDIEEIVASFQTDIDEQLEFSLKARAAAEAAVVPRRVRRNNRRTSPKTSSCSPPQEAAA